MPAVAQNAATMSLPVRDCGKSYPKQNRPGCELFVRGGVLISRVLRSLVDEWWPSFRRQKVGGSRARGAGPLRRVASNSYQPLRREACGPLGSIDAVLARSKRVS